MSVPNIELVALQTNQPAHLPLISLPGLTVVMYVVIDMGSIHSISSKNRSLASLTLMLFPRMTVLETTGPMVHMMRLNLVGDTNNRVSMRVNSVLSIAMSDMMCMIDTAIAYTNGDSEAVDLVCTSIDSGRHMAMIKFVFDILTRTVLTNNLVYMHMFVKHDLYTIMVNILNDNPKIMVHESTDWYMDLNVVRLSNSNRNMVVMMTTPITIYEMMGLMEIPNLRVSVMISI
ncbi:hypothetical protein N0V84_012379 [Fusarium piperis]|uniref:Uncharacterized protein n=1 Tax=Fusarium piperis TaxID=1435070 RepID=A0A9W8T9F9_9HYPO|nr:hypothetical protein N0V84_012379 [Fusarium piperis]